MKTKIICLICFLFFTNLFSIEIKTIHVVVALCDNENQGIIPVPQHLGDGKSPATNLYWGALYGVKTFFTNSPNWKLLDHSSGINESIAERVIFVHSNNDAFLIADAYYGWAIKEAIMDVIESACGQKEDSLKIDYDSLEYKAGIYGGADLLAYIGHNGLMEFTYDYDLEKTTTNLTAIIILACDSQSYFKTYLEDTGINPLIVTTGLMAPEAYTLENVLNGWINKESAKEIRLRAARTYNEYQKCGIKAALRLFDNKW
jgi:hypothetical protein